MLKLWGLQTPYWEGLILTSLGNYNSDTLFSKDNYLERKGKTQKRTS